MALMSDFQKRQIREGELARFDRWFVVTIMGPAYRDRDGRVRSVKPEEVARWRADVEAHVDATIARAPVQLAWAFGSLVFILAVGGWLLDLLAIAQRFHAPAIALAVFIVEIGTIGIEIWDYVGGWRERRDGIEAAVAARAPLPVDPARLGSPHNWFNIAMLALIAPVILLAMFGHLDEGLIDRVNWGWLVLIVPAAWALHFAGRWHDRRRQGR